MSSDRYPEHHRPSAALGDTLNTQQRESDSQTAVDDDQNAYERWRAGIARRPGVDLAYRIAVGIIGTAVLVVGILAIPYPGPGWLIVFAGLGILASEFAWAKKALHWVKQRYDRFMAWFAKQNLFVKGLGVALTTAFVLATLWLLGTFSLVGGWIGLDWPWLDSPL